MGHCPQCNSIMDDYDIGVCGACADEQQCTDCFRWFPSSKLTEVTEEGCREEYLCPDCLEFNKESS